MIKWVKEKFKDSDIEQLIGVQLRIGVVVASVIVIIGGIIYLMRHGNEHVPNYTNFIGGKIGYTSFSSIWDGILQNKGRAIIMLGAVALIATPLLRILFSLFGFMLEKDKLYIAITVFVLIVMCISIFGCLKG